MSPRRIVKRVPPRAAFACDAVMSKDGAVTLKFVRTGPKGVDVRDLMNVIATSAAAVLINAIHPTDWDTAREEFLDLMVSRLEAMEVSEDTETENEGEEE